MKHEIIIKDAINITGRGTILYCTLPDELLIEKEEFVKIPKLKSNDIISIDDKKYMIRSIEKISSSSEVGLIISHQYECKNFVGKTIVYNDIMFL